MTQRKKKSHLGLIIIGIFVVLCLVGVGILVALPKVEIQVSNLVVEPEEVLVGDPVVVSADVRNTGGKAGDYQATLTVNGAVQETRNLEVAAESTQSVSFTVTPTSPGEYAIDLGGLTGSFVAQEGFLPSLYRGDSWTYKVERGGEESEVNYKVLGKTTTEGEVFYFIDISWESPPDLLDSGSSFLDTGTLYAVLEEWSGTDEGVPISRKITFSDRQFQGAPWPLETGKEWTVSWEENITTKEGLLLTTDDRLLSHTFKVERIEDVTTAAGDFRCFKVVERDEAGHIIKVAWYSDKIKREVKYAVLGDGEPIAYELVSYKVSASPPTIPPPKLAFPSVTDYDEPVFGYTISYPEGWELDAAKSEEGIIEIFSSAGAGGLRLAWLRIQVVSLAGALNLDEVNQKVIEATEETDPYFELVSSIKVAAELPWYQLEWNSSISEVALRGKTIVVLKDRQVFVVTGWVQAAYSDDYGSALEEVMGSFGFRPQ
jgi:hypothetical protein